MAFTMQPVLTASPPKGAEWRYEVKYDGFRCILRIHPSGVTLTSRNGLKLNSTFPEIANFAETAFQHIEKELPLTLDGEIVFLANPFRSDFEHMQVRGRLKRPEKIQESANSRPCCFLAFDLLERSGQDVSTYSYIDRKTSLHELMSAAKLPAEPNPYAKETIQYIPSYQHFDPIWEKVIKYDGEGIVAKKINSKWLEKKRSSDWLKYKNFKHADVCITGFNPHNGFLTVSVLKNGVMTPVASVSHGMSEEEKNAIRSIMEQHGHKTASGEYTLEPSICATVQYLTILQGTLREVSFVTFQFQMDWTDCTFAQLVRRSKPVHPKLQFTSLNKIIFEKHKKTKEDFIQYMIEISDYLFPFLKDRAVTVIRYPHGSRGESFFQKNKPDYTPDFVQSFFDGSHEHVVCKDLSTLLWLANQLALEFHVPFQTITSRRPAEIVIDLDPPSRDDFLMAVQAANELKRLFESFGITSYPKLSGNKGIQLYIPLSPEAFTYEDTRQFTQLIAEYCTNAFPDLFTTERLIKNRHGKLYLDYLQHAEGKTIICPYSTRGNELGTVAAPLYWHEVQPSLTPAMYTINTVVDRVKKHGCPFYDFYRNPQDEPLAAILNQLKKKS
ncbi:DNA ligase D [Bacillus halotolerans]|uniref:DNA ligase D n=1 Tax=Bacillus halotolerans TaxID=260554 RepID=UPI0027E57FD1|nr:DNA ligase D [Bacillus halotolerans]MDQ7724664.1 DNA ligase D [Bacillus halotolerans]